ncbi:type II toxin-antitoxin system RelE/ParE family toxin [Rhodopseudomonas pseudopalustris]|uniref:Plasmid stabilization system n=2 Tax=Rhodopseudomonas TaxID=1073 RepID=Q130D1_RHOPS|nr:type II toxin-antitoxin system RelE/ParE family toxin [Rhodopseudomonas pseudopalustris]ABE41558.1 plasmid stabilization system [Rhodopseudomonas palustris BisB5]MBB1093814.1 type II toxin-antitoxin system RelE/ParE family toxin [Rhodopseudomonas palustris]SEO10691.1 Plasmid stabilization system protein ParE [Rhodopseudomonas pseudopalustris]
MRLRYTGPALAELISILDYIAEQSPHGAQRVQARIKAAINLLQSHPQIGGRTDDPTIRRLLTTPYRYLVFYEIRMDEIIIHAVRHASRDPETPTRSE